MYPLVFYLLHIFGCMYMLCTHSLRASSSHLYLLNSVFYVICCVSGDNRLRAGLLRHCSGIRPRQLYFADLWGFAWKDIRTLKREENICRNVDVCDKTEIMVSAYVRASCFPPIDFIAVHWLHCTLSTSNIDLHLNVVHRDTWTFNTRKQFSCLQGSVKHSGTALQTCEVDEK